MSSVGFRQNAASAFRTPQKDASRSEDSMGKPAGSYMVNEPEQNDSHGGNGQGSDSNEKNPILDQSKKMKIRELDEDQLHLIKSAVTELHLAAFVESFDSGYLLQDVLDALKSENIVYEWWVLRIPTLVELQGLLEDRIAHARMKDTDIVASEFTRLVFRMLLDSKRVLGQGIIGMVDPSVMVYEIENVNQSLILKKLKSVGIVTQDNKIMSIPSTDVFEKLFGSLEGGLRIRSYLWGRKDYVVSPIQTNSAKKTKFNFFRH